MQTFIVLSSHLYYFIPGDLKTFWFLFLHKYIPNDIKNNKVSFSPRKPFWIKM